MRISDWSSDVCSSDLDRWIATWIAQGFEALEAMAGDDRYLGGDTPGIADCCLVPQIYNARRFEVPLDDYPRLVAIDAACMELEAFQKRSEEHTSELQSLMRISYAVFCLKKKNNI